MRRRFGIAVLATLAVTALVAVLALKTPLLLSDLRTEPLGDAEVGRATLHEAQRAHGGRDAWLSRAWVELELDGEIPFPPARLALDVDPEVHVTVRYDPREAEVASVVVDGVEREPDLLADSVRHLFELVFAMESADVSAALPDRDGHARTFLSWRTAEPQMDYDQYIVWADREAHLVRRFDCTGRAIAPFVLARVSLENYRDVQGFAIPARVRVARAEDGALVQGWTLVEARLGPPRS